VVGLPSICPEGESAPLSDQMNGACPVPGLVSTAATRD